MASDLDSFGIRTPDPLRGFASRHGLDGSDVSGWLGHPMEDARSSLRRALEEVSADLPELSGAVDWFLRDLSSFGILCDYDVDGGTSQAILVHAARLLGVQISGDRVAVPCRSRDGFGPSESLLERLAAAGARTICVMDCGTPEAGPGGLLDRFAERAGVRVLIVDHHPSPDLQVGLQPGGRVFLFNPCAQGGSPECAALCTAGLAFVLAVASWQRSRDSLPGVQACREAYDACALLAAFGSVCDVMNMTAGTQGSRLNRFLVRFGRSLPVSAAPAGMRSLMSCIRHPRGSKQLWSANAYGWQLGPLVNAGSRMAFDSSFLEGPLGHHTSSVAAACLRAGDPFEADRLADHLGTCNEARKEAKDRAIREAVMRPAEGPVVLGAGRAGSPGVAGLVAAHMSRVLERPSIWTYPHPEKGSGEDVVWAGSGRGSGDFDLGAAIAQCAHEGLALSGGGHAAAAGIEFLQSSAQALRERLWALYEEAGSPSSPPPDSVDLTGVLASGSEDPLREILGFCESLEPFGSGFEIPEFSAEARCVPEGGIRSSLNGGTVYARGKIGSLPFMAFGSDLAESVLASSSSPSRVSFELQSDSYRPGAIIAFLRSVD